MTRPWRVRAALLAAGALLAALALRDGVAPHDEGLMLAAARRVADGQLPYRDFWFNYGPAQPYVLAALDRIAGPSLLAWRVLVVVIDAVAAVLAFELVRRTVPGRERWALGAWAAAIGALAWPALPGPNAPAIALALGALLLGAHGRPGWGGAVAGAAAVFRPEVGVAAALGVVLGVSGGPSSRARGREGTLAALGAAAAVTLAGWLPFVLAAPSRWWDETVGFLGVQHLQRLPFPLSYDGGLDPNKLLEFYVPALLVVATAGLAAWTLARRPPRATLTAWPLALAGLAYLLARPDEFHLVLLATALAVALAVAGAQERAVAVRVLLGAGLAVIAVHGVERQAGRVLHPGDLAAVPGPAGDGVRTARADAAALAVLRRRLPAGGPLLVVPPRLDRVTVGDPLLYTVLDRDNPTRYDVIQPGVVTKPGAQRTMVAALRRTRAPVVRWLDPRATRAEDDGAGRERGARIFDAYVARAYRPAFRTGPYLVLLPR